MIRGQNPFFGPYSISVKLIFAADAMDIVRGEMVVMWRNFKCGEALDVEKHSLWKIFRCGEIFKCEIFFNQFASFCQKLGLLKFMLF